MPVAPAKPRPVPAPHMSQQKTEQHDYYPRKRDHPESEQIASPLTVHKLVDRVEARLALALLGVLAFRLLLLGLVVRQRVATLPAWDPQASAVSCS